MISNLFSRNSNMRKFRSLRSFISISLSKGCSQTSLIIYYHINHFFYRKNIFFHKKTFGNIYIMRKKYGGHPCTVPEKSPNPFRTNRKQPLPRRRKCLFLRPLRPKKSPPNGKQQSPLGSLLWQPCFFWTFSPIKKVTKCSGGLRKHFSNPVGFLSPTARMS